jgi:hypothetical protein
MHKNLIKFLVARKSSLLTLCYLIPSFEGQSFILATKLAICRVQPSQRPHQRHPQSKLQQIQAKHIIHLSLILHRESGAHASPMMNFELINSSTCALSILLLPFSSSFNNTAKTSIGGSNPNLLARTHRFIRAIPMQGYKP